MSLAYLLDTNICIDLVRQRAPRAASRLVSHRVDEVAVSSLTVAELEYGVAKSRFGSMDRERLDQFLTPLQILAFDDAAAQAYGPIRAELERRGKPIGPIDLLLAAQATSLGVVLVTSNRAEFARVPGLVVEDWTRA